MLVVPFANTGGVNALLAAVQNVPPNGVVDPGTTVATHLADGEPQQKHHVHGSAPTNEHCYGITNAEEVWL